MLVIYHRKRVSNMTACTFFGHRDCYGLQEEKLENAIIGLIEKGVDTFYVGHQGHFDALVRGRLRKLQRQFSHIHYEVVLAYLSTEKQEYPEHEDTVYPEGLECVPRKFAISKRNAWMLERSQYCICYLSRSWGGAYTFSMKAKKQGKTLIQLGSLLL